MATPFGYEVVCHQWSEKPSPINHDDMCVEIELTVSKVVAARCRLYQRLLDEGVAPTDALTLVYEKYP